MRPSLRLREYIEAAKLAQQRAHSEQNPYAKQILQEIERSYYRLVEFEKWMGDQQPHNRPLAHFGMFNGRQAAGDLDRG
jgi:hypothetical protein